MSPARQISVEIDKLTRSIENAWTGESFTTAVLPLTSDDIKAIGKTYWLFDWKAEAKSKENKFSNWLSRTMHMLFKDL